MKGVPAQGRRVELDDLQYSGWGEPLANGFIHS